MTLKEAVCNYSLQECFNVYIFFILFEDNARLMF